ncbi:hypothetical protein ANN_22346 [Periplaneta americana]|uniref:RNase H type-1 domain-containing protein n=1 Tax=Periplaneta americana TaxID=6978 RepID=A0ABQ8S801_PERAM|nr:hypothetical protein ANN_22346 [Periplaneta americana]
MGRGEQGEGKKNKVKARRTEQGEGRRQGKDKENKGKGKARRIRGRQEEQGEGKKNKGKTRRTRGRQEEQGEGKKNKRKAKRKRERQGEQGKGKKNRGKVRRTRERIGYSPPIHQPSGRRDVLFVLLVMISERTLWQSSSGSEEIGSERLPPITEAPDYIRPLLEELKTTLHGSTPNPILERQKSQETRSLHQEGALLLQTSWLEKVHFNHYITNSNYDHMGEIDWYKTGKQTNFIPILIDHELQDTFLQDLSPDTVTAPPLIIDIPNTINDHLLLKSVTSQEISHVLASRRNTAPGPDNIPYLLLKKLPNKYLLLLANSFNEILTTGEVPDKWKLFYIQSIIKPLKKGTAISDYRPIFLWIPGHKGIRGNEKVDQLAQLATSFPNAATNFLITPQDLGHHFLSNPTEECQEEIHYKKEEDKIRIIKKFTTTYAKLPRKAIVMHYRVVMGTFATPQYLFNIKRRANNLRECGEITPLITRPNPLPRSGRPSVSEDTVMGKPLNEASVHQVDHLSRKL